MTAVDRVLIIGAGLAGCAAAIRLAEAGVSVELIDVKPDVAAVGSGITLQGNALRALNRLGVWDTVQRKGYAFNTLGLRAPDANGTLLVELDDVRTGGPDLPATAGMYRPDLARILIDRAVDVGAKVRFGVAGTRLTQYDADVEVTFSDGTASSYDLVIGADGVRSWTRQAIGIELETQPTGMGIWRIFAPRPAGVTRTDLIYGGPSYIAGYCPTGENTLYAYIVEPAVDRSDTTPEERLDIVRELASAYHGPWDDIRAGLTDPSRINYTKFETHVLEAPWNRRRVVVIGDAAHVCPPTLAQGGAQALEDALVLTELLVDRDTMDNTLWEAFADRRLPRVKTVVDASLQLGRWLIDYEKGDVPGLMARVAHLVGQEP
ncbi:FAD-dependent monooxygenase [Nakamurella sp. GG22]